MTGGVWRKQRQAGDLNGKQVIPAGPFCYNSLSKKATAIRCSRTWPGCRENVISGAGKLQSDPKLHELLGKAQSPLHEARTRKYLCVGSLQAILVGEEDFLPLLLTDSLAEREKVLTWRLSHDVLT